MSSWGSTFFDIPGGSGTKYTGWHKCYYNFPTDRSPGCAAIFPKCNAAPLLEENPPEKRRAIEKWTLFDLLPTDILNIIDNWIAGLEQIVKLKTPVTQIHG